MADSTIPGLDAVTAPLATDVLPVRQSADSRDKKMTRAQIHSLVSGEHLILPQVSEVATPTLAFGDGDTGFYEISDDTIVSVTSGVDRFQFSGGMFRGAIGNGPAILNENASTVNPTLVPNKLDTDTGLGWPAANQLSLVAGALDCIQVSNVSAARRIGFYVTAPVALQTGVAVTAAGIHAALVNLGLITA